jgi:hypothetical protein
MGDALSTKDYLLIGLGFALGGYASLIASRIVLWMQLRHDAFCTIELMSGLMNGQSVEFKEGQHHPDRLLEAQAIEFYFHGHDGAYRECHKIANEVQTALERIRPIRHPHCFEITTIKTDWLKRVAGLRPSVLSLFRPWPRRSMDKVLDAYMSKESEYLRHARDSIAREGEELRT